MRDALWAGVAVGVAGSALLDERVRADAQAHRGATWDGLADVGDALGRGRDLIPAMGAAYVAARLAHRRGAARAVEHMAVAYTAGNVLVSVLKPAVGRHRPDSTDDAARFRPFGTRGAWHSFPSAHTIHAVTIATALDAETRSPWVAAAAYGAAGVVAWSRVYDDAHWMSDVVGSAVLGVVTAKVALRWLRRR